MPTELTNNGSERKLKQGVDTRGGPGVLQTSARRTQQLSNCEKMVIEKNLMAVYQKRMMEDLKSHPSNSKKLQVLTLEDNKILGPIQKPAVICKTS